MSAPQRRQQIMVELASGEVDVRALARRFSVSESTIRRDLRTLSREGLARRTYGGALAARPVEPTQEQKRQRHVAAKQAVARSAARDVQQGDTLVLDAGSTTGLLAWELRHREELTVLTNGVSVLDALRDHPGIQLVLTGGTLRPVSQSLLGPLAEQALALVTPDHVFVGADGIDPEHGLNCPSLQHSAWKRSLLQRGRVATVLADASKLDAAPHDWWAPVPTGVRLITDAGCTAAQRARLVEAGYAVTIAGDPEPE